MCLNLFKRPDPGVMQGLPPVAKSQDTDTALPEAQDLRPEKDVDTDITYGKGRKEQQQQKAQGARSLAINLPNTAQPGAQTGGLNANQNQL